MANSERARGREGGDTDAKLPVRVALDYEDMVFLDKEADHYDRHRNHHTGRFVRAIIHVARPLSRQGRDRLEYILRNPDTLRDILRPHLELSEAELELLTAAEALCRAVAQLGRRLPPAAAAKLSKLARNPELLCEILRPHLEAA